MQLSTMSGVCRVMTADKGKISRHFLSGFPVECSFLNYSQGGTPWDGGSRGVPPLDPPLWSAPFYLPVCLVGRLSGWLSACLVGCLLAWLVVCLPGWLSACLVGCLLAWLVVCLPGWLAV